MNLVIEVGNTNIKYALFEGLDIIKRYTQPTSNKTLVQDILNHKIDRAILAGSGDMSDILWENLKCPRYVFDRTMIKDMEIAYHTPETLGQDRLLNAYAVSHDFPNRNSLIIDCGTCITTTFLDEKNRLQGGSISPGVAMRFKALHHYTARLPLVAFDRAYHPSLLGMNTPSSIESGVLVGAIDEIVARMEAMRSVYPNLNIIMTGGDALFFQNKIKNEIFVDSHLTLRGLNFVLKDL